jgi:hypothetical protein
MTLPRRLLLLAALPAACASPSPSLYVIAPVPGPVRNGARDVIELRAIALPRYLERSQIVRSTESYRVEVLPNEWWGEPLDAMLGRVLVANLAQRLPAGTVFADSGAVTATADRIIEANLTRLDTDRQGVLRLTALVALSGRGKQAPGPARSVAIGVRPQDTTTTALVAAISEAVGQMADAIAAML